MNKQKKSRAYLAGILLIKAIIEMVNLFYQKNTARNFLSGVIDTLEKEKSKFQ